MLGEGKPLTFTVNTFPTSRFCQPETKLLKLELNEASTRYPVTLRLSTAAFQFKRMALEERAVALKLVGALGGCVSLKSAFTAISIDIVTTHVPVPKHAPLQPENALPDAAVAVNVTTVFDAYSSVQSAPQVIPAGEDATVPIPVPERVTLSRCCVCWMVNVQVVE